MLTICKWSMIVYYCTCMYTCTYTKIHTCIHVHVHTCIHVHVHVQNTYVTSTYTKIHVHICGVICHFDYAT